MSKQEILEQAVALLERANEILDEINRKLEQPAPVFVPHFQRCTCGDSWWGTVPPPPCPIHRWSTEVSVTTASITLHPENQSQVTFVG